MQIDLAKFEAADVIRLLHDYLEFASADACTHTLGLAELQKADVQMFTAQNRQGDLLGCAALKRLNESDGEIKSVRTHQAHVRKGVSRALMTHIESTARDSGRNTLYLETHNTPPYAAARRMYENLGYEVCGPFGDYTQTPRNIFMVKSL